MKYLITYAIMEMTLSFDESKLKDIRMAISDFTPAGLICQLKARSVTGNIVILNACKISEQERRQLITASNPIEEYYDTEGMMNG